MSAETDLYGNLILLGFKETKFYSDEKWRLRLDLIEVIKSKEFPGYQFDDYMFTEDLDTEKAVMKRVKKYLKKKETENESNTDK